jgi:hypothetical protein
MSVWHPLLEGDLAVRAEDAVRAIAEALGGLPGNASAALFFSYLGESARADELMEQAIDDLASTPMPPALFSGFTEIAWTAEHLSTADDDDLCEAIDESLLTALAPPWTGTYDLISGLAGFGVYALERVPRPSAVRCLEAIVDRLHETAEIHEKGVTWFTPPGLLPPRNREQHPRGYYNLGVAHGVPGVIGLLAEVCRLGIRVESARPLLEGATLWVLAHRGTRFPAWIVPGIEPQPTRLAWCYGTPGVAAVVLSAARVLGNEEWERMALDIALDAAMTPPEKWGVQDAGLCHGALGLAHLYNRIYQSCDDERFASTCAAPGAASPASRRGSSARTCSWTGATIPDSSPAPRASAWRSSRESGPSNRSGTGC